MTIIIVFDKLFKKTNKFTIVSCIITGNKPYNIITTDLCDMNKFDKTFDNKQELIKYICTLTYNNTPDVVSTLTLYYGIKQKKKKIIKIKKIDKINNRLFNIIKDDLDSTLINDTIKLKDSILTEKSVVILK